MGRMRALTQIGADGGLRDGDLGGGHLVRRAHQVVHAHAVQEGDRDRLARVHARHANLN